MTGHGCLHLLSICTHETSELSLTMDSVQQEHRELSAAFFWLGLFPNH